MQARSVLVIAAALGLAASSTFSPVSPASAHDGRNAALIGGLIAGALVGAAAGAQPRNPPPRYYYGNSPYGYGYRQYPPPAYYPPTGYYPPPSPYCGRYPYPPCRY